MPLSEFNELLAVLGTVAVASLGGAIVGKTRAAFLLSLFLSALFILYEIELHRYNGKGLIEVVSCWNADRTAHGCTGSTGWPDLWPQTNRPRKEIAVTSKIPKPRRDPQTPAYRPIIPPESARVFSPEEIEKAGGREPPHDLSDGSDVLQILPIDAQPRAHKIVGDRFYAQGKYASAIQEYGNAIQGDPSFAVAFNNRGNANWQLSRPLEAYRDYDLAVRARPDLVFAHWQRANAITFIITGEAVGKLFAKIFHLQPRKGSDEERFALGATGKADYAMVLDQQPYFALGWYNLSILESFLGETAAAAEHETHALKLNPNVRTQPGWEPTQL